MTFEEWKNIHLCDDDRQIIALCEEAFQAGERAGMCIRHEEYFSQEVNHHAKCPWCALEQAEEMVATMQRVVDMVSEMDTIMGPYMPKAGSWVEGLHKTLTKEMK